MFKIITGIPGKKLAAQVIKHPAIVDFENIIHYCIR